mgnify:CR=1 FL=1
MRNYRDKNAAVLEVVERELTEAREQLAASQARVAELAERILTLDNEIGGLFL